MSKVLILIISFFIFPSCSYWKVLDYYDMVDPVRIKKQEEKGKIVFYDGEQEPPWPNYLKNNTSIEGVDSNNNGVRDDVEIWINRTYNNSYNLRKATKSLARTTHALLLSLKQYHDFRNKINEKSILVIAEKMKGEKLNVNNKIHQRDIAHVCLSFLLDFNNPNKIGNSDPREQIEWLEFYSTEERGDMYYYTLRGILFVGAGSGLPLCESWKVCDFLVEDSQNIETKCKNTFLRINDEKK